MKEDSCGKPADDPGGDNLCQSVLPDDDMVVEDRGCENTLDGVPEELPCQLNSQKYQLECHDVEVAEDISLDNKLMAQDSLSLEEADSKSQEVSAGLEGSLAMESDATERGNNEEHYRDIGQVFEPWCVLVEYGRKEDSCSAAHCLHGRLFDDRIVTVEYVALDLYRTRFPK